MAKAPDFSHMSNADLVEMLQQTVTSNDPSDVEFNRHITNEIKKRKPSPSSDAGGERKGSVQGGLDAVWKAAGEQWGLGEDPEALLREIRGEPPAPPEPGTVGEQVISTVSYIYLCEKCTSQIRLEDAHAVKHDGIRYRHYCLGCITPLPPAPQVKS